MFNFFFGPRLKHMFIPQFKLGIMRSRDVFRPITGKRKYLMYYNSSYYSKVKKYSPPQIIEPLTEKTWGQGCVIFGERKNIERNGETPLIRRRKYFEWIIISNYWMRLSRIWRILQIKEGVIHRGRRPRWITPSEIFRIFHILRKPNSITALLFIQNISSFLKEFRHFALCFSAH